MQAAEEPLRVLVIDDNRDAADILALLLRKRGNQVQTVYRSIDALPAAEAFRPHCIISDIGMPGLDGYEVARRFRSDQRFQKTRLIALTAYADADKAMASGFDFHLLKPVNVSAVSALINDVGALWKRVVEMEDAIEEQTKVLGDVKDLMHEVKDDVKEIKAELKEEIQELKQELREVQAEVKEIKEELAPNQDASRAVT